jgi:hypothetical protein
MSKKILLFLILGLGLGLRLYGLNWDQGHHLHPDERMIVMVTERLSYPKSLSEFLSVDSPLNPKFFAYGSFPIYFLKVNTDFLSAIGFEKLATYQYLPLAGRFFSALFDVGTIFIIFKISKKLFKSWQKALLAFFLYATAVFPIQDSHFYTTDVILNFFIWLCLWRIINFLDETSLRNAILIGITFGLALATKVSAVLLIAPIFLSLVIKYKLFNIKQWKLEKLKKTFFYGIMCILFAAIVFLVFQPYAVIDFKTFWRQIQEQGQMTKDAYVFPYTLQYVGTQAYFYPLKQMFCWGLGIFLGSISIFGVFYYLITLVRRVFISQNFQFEINEIIISFFAVIYFIIVGRFEVKFMRYMLPIYPFFIISGAFLIYEILNKINLKTKYFISAIFLFGHLFWLFAFMSIYTPPHTRVQASQWMHENIEAGAVLAVEHWDDRLPLSHGEKFNYLEMPMYEPDDSEEKWQKVKINLEEADYIILSSNRLYLPLQKLDDCSKYKRCYPKTAKYYQDLFSGRLGFKKVIEFSSYPRIKIGKFKLEIIDDFADESFTVYDHPKVIIFEKK